MLFNLRNVYKKDGDTFGSNRVLNAQNKIKDLTDASSEIMKGLIKRIGDMPPSDYDKVINLSKELADLKTLATEIYNSDSSNKEQLIKKEGEYIRTLDCVNKRIAGRSNKESGIIWRENNKDFLVK